MTRQQAQDFRFWIKSTLGAFSDTAVLFPLMVALSIKSGFPATLLLLSAGSTYLLSAYLFRVPMSVQPLKSIAIAGMTLGATYLEIRVAAGILGLVCLSLTLFDVNQIAKKIPKSLIHGVQLGLGILLVIQGWKYGVLWCQESFLGRSSECTLLVSAAQGSVSHSWNQVRVSLLVSLVLPQLALTFANSVLGTQSAARRYFGDQASRVTVRRLLQSIGLGNIVSAFLGGLPFCHGSGGVTAHFRGGATHWISNVLIGLSLMLLGGVAWWRGVLEVGVPYSVLSCLLILTGVFHIQLVQDTWRARFGKIKLLCVGLVVVISQDLFWALMFGLFLELVFGLIASFKNVSWEQVL